MGLITEVTEAVRVAAEALAHANPGVKIEEAYNTIVPTEENYAASMKMLYEGALIAVLVVFIFLWDWRATVLAATALPLSIIPTGHGFSWIFPEYRHPACHVSGGGNPCG